MAKNSALLKRPSAIAYDQQTAKIILADKTGEVHSFPWPLSPSEQEHYNRINTLSKDPVTRPEDERFMGTFLLGHSSSVVAVSLLSSRLGRFLVTVDRDEHVRISVFPETYIIHAMGLGHTAFVSAVVSVREGIISGGGDKRIIQWDVDGNNKAEYTCENGSCVRWIRKWKDEIVVVCDGYLQILLNFAEQRSSIVEILQLDGLRPVQKIEMDTPVLDVAFLDDTMYISLDAKQGQWVKEYTHTGKEWKIIESNQWEITKREETSVEMYWLEKMRKRIGQGDEE